MDARTEYLLHRQDSTHRVKRHDSNNCKKVDLLLVGAKLPRRQLRCGRASKISSEIAEYMDQQLEEDDKLSSVKLQRW